MKTTRLSIIASMVSLTIAATGCMQGEPGGPGVRTEPPTTTQTANKPVIDDSRETFLLRTPALSTTVKRGETKSVSIAVSRGSEFKDDVQITLSGLPTGVTVNPMTSTLGDNQKELKVDIAASSDAELGDFSLLIKGHPMKGGPDATNHLKISVASN